MPLRLAAILIAVALFASALGLVTSQFRARSLFVDLEAAQQQARSLEDEASRLRVELGRLTQPANVAAAARGMGLAPIEATRTVFLPQRTAPAAANDAGAAAPGAQR